MKVLAVSSTEKSLAMLRSLISDAGALPSLASSAAAAKRRILDEDWDSIIINYPLMDEPGIELAHMAATETDAAVIMLMRSDASSLYAKRLSEDGMMVVEKPIMREALCSALSLVPYLQALKAALNTATERSFLSLMFVKRDFVLRTTSVSPLDRDKDTLSLTREKC